MLGKFAIGLAAAVLALNMTSGPARAEEGVKAGLLACNVDSGWGFVFGSTREIKCSFTHGGGSVEHYAGHIRKFGVDIGYLSGGVVAWAVLAPTTDVGKGARGRLRRRYRSATVVGGAGVNVLVGGFKNSFSLQPVSFEGNAGLNVAGGIAEMTLEYQAQ